MCFLHVYVSIYKKNRHLKTLLQLLFSLYSTTGSRKIKAIPLHERFNSLVEINRNETLDQLIKGSILEPCGVVGTTFPNDVSINYFIKEFFYFTFHPKLIIFHFSANRFSFWITRKTKIRFVGFKYSTRQRSWNTRLC